MSIALEAHDHNDASIRQSNPAATQVTSSQILHEAHESKRSTLTKPKQDIRDLEELRLFQLTKRRNYEQQLNKNRLNYGQWMRYAKWEIEQNHDFKRGRSVLERALEVNVQHVPFWVRYIELELLYKNVNHARNLLNRAVTTLPRTDKFWFMYVQIEESLANFKAVREIFERWLKWHPMRGAWLAYTSFEERYNETDNAREIYRRYVAEFPDSELWVQWIDFELKQPLDDDEHKASIRGIFETAADSLLAHKSVQQDSSACELLSRWITWEASQGETDRSQTITSKLLEEDFLLKEQKVDLVKRIKNHHSLSSAGDNSILKQKLQLEKNVTSDPFDYDSWWELSRIVDSSEAIKFRVTTLESAIAHTPKDVNKLTQWRRYIFLWINLALLYEFECKDIAKARDTWKRALAIVPHKRFSFAKLWIMFAQFEIRNEKSLVEGRKILGRAIGYGCQAKPKSKIFKFYISTEKELSEYERVRKIYAKWLEVSYLHDKLSGGTLSHDVLLEYLSFEKSMNESERCIELYRLGIKEEFDNGTMFLSQFIEFLKEEFRYDDARNVLREEIASRDEAIVWIMLALFESSILSPEQINTLATVGSEETDFELEEYHVNNTRLIFEEAYNHFKKEHKGADAITLLKSWKDFESEHGDAETISRIEGKMPNLVTKQREIDGMTEEYYDYEFPGPKINKFLANARKWANAS